MESEQPRSETWAERVSRAGEADIEWLRANRLPDEDRLWVAFHLCGGRADEHLPHAAAFEAGYRFGNDAEMFGMFDETTTDALKAVAHRVRDERWGIVRGRHLADGVFAAQGARCVFNADATSFATVDEAFAANRMKLARGFAGSGVAVPREADLTGLFHAGALFYAAETEILRELLWQARVAEVERLERAERPWWRRLRRPR